MQSVIDTPDAKVMQEEHSPLIAKAKSIKVTTLAEHGVAKETLQALSMRKRAIKERLDPLAEHANKVHKGITGLRADLLAPIEQAEEYVGLECTGYEDREQKRAEEEARVREAAAKKLEEDIKILQAQDAAASGDRLAAEEILNEPIETPTFRPAPRFAKAEGESSRTVYSAECVDIIELAKHVVAHPEDAALIQANGPGINARARSQKDGFKLAGCKLVKEKSRSFRAV